jgi:hypothetical protein
VVTLATTLVTPPLLRWSFAARGAQQPIAEPGIALVPAVTGD